MEKSGTGNKERAARRSFLKKGVLGVGAAAVGAGLLAKESPAFGQDREEGSLTRGDVAILQLLLAAEIIETDLWQQYKELGGVEAAANNPVVQPYVNGLVQLDGRLTNLKQLSVDTSWWTRYRSKENLDLGAPAFPQAVPSLSQGQHPAIPATPSDLNDPNHIQAIANTAGFHFDFIEQAGTSLYATLSQRVSSPEVLRITISIGGSEILHFQVWHDKAGNAVPLTDNQPGGTLTFVNLAIGQPESLQANLIMPEPTDFIKGLPECSIIRPTGAGQLDATGAINGFIADGLFIGQPKELQQFLLQLAREADEARRES